MSHSRLRAASCDLLVPLLVYGAATVWFTWPLPWLGANHLVTSSPALLNDVYLILWILSWVGRALITDPAHVFDGNVLHPTPHVLASSEHLLGDMPLFVPVWLASDNAILAMNSLTFASFVLTALAMHFLARRWIGGSAAAWVAGCAFAFAPWRADLGRPHLLQVQYLPLIAYGLDRVVASGRTRTALLTAAVLAMQVLCSCYLGYAAYLMVGTFVVVWLARGGWQAGRTVWRALAITLLAPLVLVVPASIPYLLARSNGALAIELTQSLLTEWQSVGRPALVVACYVGWGTAALASIGAVPALHSWRTDRVQSVRLVSLIVAAVLAVLLAAGPAGSFDGWVSPYAWLTVMVPGFGSLRSPTRFGIVASFALSLLAAYGVARLERALAARGIRRAGLVVGALAIVVSASWLWVAPPFSVRQAPTRAGLSRAHQWLAKHGHGGPLLELPIARSINLGSARAMFASTYHWLPLLNGHTGYMPPASAFLNAHAQQLPSPGSLQMLVDCAGLEWILVHRATTVRRAAWRSLAGVRLLKEFPPDRKRAEVDQLYQVVLPTTDACPGLFTPATTVSGNLVTTVATPRGSLTAQLPSLIPATLERRIDLSLHNEDAVLWPATAVDPQTRFTVGYSWQPADGGGATPWREIPLPQDVAPGERLDLGSWIAAPGRPGVYVLRLRAGQGEEPAAPLVAGQLVEIGVPR